MVSVLFSRLLCCCCFVFQLVLESRVAWVFLARLITRGFVCTLSSLRCRMVFYPGPSLLLFFMCSQERRLREGGGSVEGPELPLLGFPAVFSNMEAWLPMPPGFAPPELLARSVVPFISSDSAALCLCTVEPCPGGESHGPVLSEWRPLKTWPQAPCALQPLGAERPPELP